MNVSETFGRSLMQSKKNRGRRTEPRRTPHLVERIVQTTEERDAIFDVLDKYRVNTNICDMVLSLKQLIDCPSKLQLYQDIRYIIPLKDQVTYDRLIPSRGYDNIRTVRLKRKRNEGLGFAVRGGLEHGTGLYVSQVVTDSQAYKHGLRVGDEILRMNGFVMKHALHDESLLLIKSQNQLTMRVKQWVEGGLYVRRKGQRRRGEAVMSILFLDRDYIYISFVDVIEGVALNKLNNKDVGMIPIKEENYKSISWKYSETIDPKRKLSELSSDISGQLINVIINMTEYTDLGCSICSGVDQLPGIFIQSIRPQSITAQLGLHVGDQIVEVNHVNFTDITKEEAVAILTGSYQLEFIVKKQVARSLMTTERNGTIKPESPTISRLMQNNQLDNVRNSFLTASIASTIESSLSEGPCDESITPESLVNDINAQSSSGGDSMSNNSTVYGIPKRASLLSDHQSPLKIYQHNTAMKRANSNATQVNGSVVMRAHSTVSDVRLSQLSNSDVRLSQLSGTGVRLSGSSMGLSTSDVHPGSPVEPAPDYSTSSLPPKSPVMGIRRRIHQIEQNKIQNKSMRQSTDSKQYMSEERVPSFRIQKPVLLSPMSKVNSNPIAEELIIERPYQAENFNPLKIFTPAQLSGRTVKLVDITKGSTGNLGIGLQVKDNSVIVTEIYKDGPVHKHGFVNCGDQILMVDGNDVCGLTQEQAQTVLHQTFTNNKREVQLIVAKAPRDSVEEKIFPAPDYDPEIPVSNLDDVMLPDDDGDDDIPYTIL